MSETLHLRTCSLCEAMCGLEVTVTDGQVSSVRPNEKDVWSQGYICPKGASIGDLHHDPDRIRVPMIRDGESWREVTWDEAFAEIERRLHPVIEDHGASALTAYIGNPSAHNYSLQRYIGAFVAMSGIEVIYSAGTVDQWPKNVSSALMYGGMWTIPVPDIDRTDYLLALGANPAASQGSLLAAPDILHRLDRIRERGGKFIVVDPRKTGTAERADEWIPIRPGTDAAFLLAVAQVLFAEDLVDLKHLTFYVNGLDGVERAVAEFAPEVVAECCQIPADTIRRIARELAAAPSAAVYGRIGTCNQEFGTLASWMVDVLNVLTGNLDRPGGAMFSSPIAKSISTLRPPDFADGFEFGRFKSRVRGAPEVLGQFPISCLAEEISTPGEGQIKALITIAGNPAISAPDALKLQEALPQLDCMVSVDNYLNETTRHAHVLLPGLSPLEQPHCGDLLRSWAVRNAIQYCDTIFEPIPGRPHEWELMLRLAWMASGQPNAEIDVAMLDDLYFGGLVGVFTEMAESPIHGMNADEIVSQTAGSGPDRILEFLIRSGEYGDNYGRNPGGLTFEEVKVAKNGIDLGALEPRLERELQTESRKIDLAPPYILGDLGRLRERLTRKENDLVLVSRRHLRSNNSWVHNVDKLMRGRERCTLLVHPGDAERFGLTDGGAAIVKSEAGSVQVPIEVTDEMMPGVVSLPHGWGHDVEGTRLSVAARRPGVNNNFLAPGELVDVLSGNAVVNGIPVEIEAV